MSINVTMLGSGSSGGVPMIGCTCPVCTSDNPKNKRSRVSLHIETEGKSLLIDSSPDLREQALKHDIKRLDAVFYTHDHADHTHGLDDLRSFNYLNDAPLPVYTNKATVGKLQERFAYAFQEKPPIWFRPCLIPHILPDEPMQEIDIAGVSMTVFEQRHGKSKTLGLRIGQFGYSIDTDYLPDTAFAALEGVDIWVVDCLRYRESPSHAHLDKTLGWIDQVKPKIAVLTHMAHDFDYDILSKELPPGVVPGYDGMILSL